MQQKERPIFEMGTKPRDRPVVETVPPGYTEVRLVGSAGRLSTPAVIHVRNYTFEEALALAQATEENIDETIIEVLSGMILEDVDAGALHVEEVKEILLNVYAAWWGKTLDVYYYAVDPDKPMENENRSVASLPITAIDIKSLPDDVWEPICIEDPATRRKVRFILPRIINSVIINRRLDEMFAEEDARFSDLRYILKRNETLPEDQQLPYDVDQMRLYTRLELRKISERAMTSQALQLYAVDDVKLETLEQKLEALKTVPLPFFSRYLEQRKTRFDFGVQESVKFRCAVKETDITRRFPFRYVDFIPALDQVGDSGYTVSFG